MKKKIFYFVFLLLSISSLLALPCTAMANNYPLNICEELPEQVTVRIQTTYYLGGPAYFPEIQIAGIGEKTILDGTHEGWCFDTDKFIGTGLHTANVYSSYCDELPVELVEYPENMDLVNYLLNQNYVGTTASGGNGNFTYSDVQRAIWELIDDNTSEIGLQGWSSVRVAEIVADAYVNGEGFEPGCGDLVIVILAPVDGTQLLGVPLISYEGMTPSFWKNHTGFYNWFSYAENDLVGDVFNIPEELTELSDDTLFEALNYAGGEEAIGMACNLLRAAVAALLNATHPDINYPMAMAEIIQEVNDVLAALDRDAMEQLKDDLDDYNNFGACLSSEYLYILLLMMFFPS